MSGEGYFHWIPGSVVFARVMDAAGSCSSFPTVFVDGILHFIDYNL